MQLVVPFLLFHMRVEIALSVTQLISQ